MPLYEYECPKDGTFEKIRKFSDPPLVACPMCGGPIEKLLSAPAIQFKGTGWYVTDYAKRSGPTDVKSESKSDKDSSAKEAAPAAPDKTDKSGKAKDTSKPSPASAPAKTK